MVLKSRHETRDTRHEQRITDKENIRYDSVDNFIYFRTFTDDFDYNLRFLILIVPYAYRDTVPHVVPRALSGPRRERTRGDF